jgi:uncharacterized protein (TIGR03437 family)
MAALAGSIPALTLTPPSLSFGTVDLKASQTITVTNTGAASATIRNINLTGMNPGDFGTSGTCAGASLAATHTCNLIVTFTPVTQGIRTAALSVVANAPGSPILVPLGGTGINCGYIVTPNTLAPPRSGWTFSLDIQAGTTCPWTVSGLPTWITAGANSGAGSGTLTLTVAANTGGSRSAQISVAGVAVAINQASNLVEVADQGVVNAASYTAPVAPGSIASVFGNLLLPSAIPVNSFPIPTSLGGLSFQFDSRVLAPLFYANASQANAQVPWELAGLTQTIVVATNSGQSSVAQLVKLATYAPGIFTINGQGTGQGAIVDPGYRLVDSTNPATAGSSVVVIYCTGLGPVTNQPATGAPSPGNPLAQTTTVPTVTIGGAPATVQFSGLAPGFVGLYQVNAEVPLAAAKGATSEVVITIGGATSNSVAMAVQ